MKWVAEITYPKPRRFEITQEGLYNLQNHQVAVEFHLIAYENGEGFDDSHQDTLALAQEIAFEDFQVPLNAWKQIE